MESRLAETVREYSHRDGFDWHGAAKFCDNMVLKKFSQLKEHPSWNVIGEVVSSKDSGGDRGQTLVCDEWIIHLYTLHFVVLLTRAGLEAQARAIEEWVGKFVRHVFTSGGGRGRATSRLLVSEVVRKLPLTVKLADVTMHTALLGMAQCSDFADWSKRYPTCVFAFIVQPRYLFEIIDAGLKRGWVDVRDLTRDWGATRDLVLVEDVPAGLWLALLTMPGLEGCHAWALTKAPRLSLKELAVIMDVGDREVRDWALKCIGKLGKIEQQEEPGVVPGVTTKSKPGIAMGGVDNSGGQPDRGEGRGGHKTGIV